MVDVEMQQYPDQQARQENHSFGVMELLVILIKGLFYLVAICLFLLAWIWFIGSSKVGMLACI